MPSPRMTKHTQTVLRVLLGQDSDLADRTTIRTEGLYGLELSRRSGLPNGTLFPLLERLQQAGWVERYWEADASAEAEGRPRRRFYRLSAKGADLAPHALAEATANAPSTVRSGTLAPGLAGGSS
ncbi:PadR family transcriptional regulator [Streptomyces sp. NPDC057638]|uniref:PadR family transcriptional regulator n=1 Tax=Streptomyces sp. NPDC057638 TaxID=3346190 RepID=UPI0036784208